MGKLVVRTKFNASGKRILTTPLNNNIVLSPATRYWKSVYSDSNDRLNAELDLAKERYRQTLLSGVASQLNVQVTLDDKRRVTGMWLRDVFAPTEPPTWSILIPAIASVEKSAWANYQEDRRAAFSARDEALTYARGKCAEMREELWREVEVAFGVRTSTDL